MGFLREAAREAPRALILDTGGFLPVGEVPLRDDPEAGRHLVALILNSLRASGVGLTAVEPGVLEFLRRTAPTETEQVEDRLLVAHPPGDLRLLLWSGREAAIYAVDRSWSDQDLMAIGERARAAAEITVAIARANAIDGRRIARLTQADLVTLSRGARPRTPLREGRSWMVGAGKLGREVAEVVLVPDDSGWRVAGYEYHPMSDRAPSDPGFRAAVEALLQDYGAGWDIVTTVLD